MTAQGNADSSRASGPRTMLTESTTLDNSDVLQHHHGHLGRMFLGLPRILLTRFYPPNSIENAEVSCHSTSHDRRPWDCECIAAFCQRRWSQKQTVITVAQCAMGDRSQHRPEGKTAAKLRPNGMLDHGARGCGYGERSPPLQQ